MFQRNSELLNCKVTSIKYKYNIKDLSRNIINKDISVNDIFKCKIRLSKEISFDVYQRSSDKPVLRILKNLKPNYHNEKFLIKDVNGKVLQKSENLNKLIDKTSWNNLKIVK